MNTAKRLWYGDRTREEYENLTGNVMNEKAFAHMMGHGTVAEASRCDFKDGLTLKRPSRITAEQFASDLMELAGWHATNILPRLNGFQGYDCIKITIKSRS